MINIPLATTPRSMNGNTVGAELAKARQQNVQLELDNARLKRRADKYEQLFLAACCLSLFLGSVLMLVAWGRRRINYVHGGCFFSDCDFENGSLTNAHRVGD